MMTPTRTTSLGRSSIRCSFSRRNPITSVRDILLALLLAASCGGQQEVAPRPNTWQDEIGMLGRSGLAMYSLAYAGAPENNGEALVITLENPAGVVDECSARYRDMSLQRDHFWYLRIVTANSEVGTYRVVPDITWTTNREAVASAELVHVNVVARTKRRYVAAAGEVIIRERPTAERMASSQHLTGAATLRFPSSPWWQTDSGCSGGIAVDAGTIEQSCECTSTAGEVRRCASADGSDCCPALESGQDSVASSFTFDATPCRWMCLALTSDGEAYCARLQR